MTAQTIIGISRSSKIDNSAPNSEPAKLKMKRTSHIVKTIAIIVIIMSILFKI